MAFNPSPKVALARDFAKKFDQKMVIIFHIDGAERIGYASYGKNKLLCNEAKKIADTIFDRIMREGIY
jgi:hypothetical protein